MATKEEKAAEKKAAAEEKAAFAALKKEAKKLGVEFDKETPQAELQILVDAAKGAAQAQVEKANENQTPPPTGTEEAKILQVEAPVVDPSGDVIIQKHKTRGGEIHILAQRGSGYVVKNPAGVVTSTFDDLNAAKHHMENLSRF